MSFLRFFFLLVIFHFKLFYKNIIKDLCNNNENQSSVMFCSCSEKEKGEKNQERKVITVT